MTDNSNDSTATDGTGGGHPGDTEGNGPTQIPEESVASESELKLDNQPAARDRNTHTEQGTT